MIGSGGFWEGRSTLVMPAIVGGFSLFLLIGSAMLDPGEAEFPGPRFVPLIIGGAGLVIALLLAVEALRRPEPVDDPTPGRYRTHSDFASLAWVAGELRSARGDLVVSISVDTPTRLDPRQEELLRELAAIRGEETPDGQVEAPHKSMFGRLREAFQG